MSNSILFSSSMKKSAVEQQNGQNTKLSFRVKDQLASDTLAYIKQKTGWTTSRTVRIALLWYLFTNYGEIYEFWLDGANGGTGWYGGADENRHVDRKTYYDWKNTMTGWNFSPPTARKPFDC